MNKWDFFQIALKSLLNNKRRSIICMIAIAIGIFSVSMVDSVSSYGEKAIVEQLSSLGMDGIMFYPKEGSYSEITEEDAQMVLEKFKEVSGVYPLSVVNGTYRSERSTENAIVMGVSEGHFSSVGVDFLYGRNMNRHEIQSEKKVLVIDENLAQNLYGRQNVVGKEMEIILNGTAFKYTIVGVTQSQTELVSAFAQVPAMLYVPYTCVGQNIDQLVVKCFHDADYETAQQKISNFLEHSVGGAIESQNIDGYKKLIESIISMVRWMLLALGSIAFIVAIIGVVDSMLSAVSERKREIGIYLALGARRRDVYWLILWESVMICLFGCGAGMLAGGAAVLVLRIVLHVAVSVRMTFVLTAVASSVLFGILAALLPAKIAVNSNPIDALRK